MHMNIHRAGGKAATILTLLLGSATIAQAQVFDPIIELFRLGPAEHLIIDRGGPVDQAGDVNGDGLDDVIVGSGIGGIRVVFGPTNGFNGTLNAQQLNGNNGFVIVHDTENISVLAGIGDMNADGINDVLVGSLGGTHVVFGRNGGFTGTVDVSDLDGSNGFNFASPTTSVSAAGDINGDGIVDILVGNPNASPNAQTGAGVTYVIYGSRNAFPATLTPADLDGSNGFAVIGSNSEDRSGRFVGRAGDFNGDGVDDFMIGAPNKTQGDKAEAGEAYLLFGSTESFPAAISLADIDGGNGFVFKGSNIQDSTGAAVTAIGDLNHDGMDDIAIGAPGKGPFGSPSDYPGEVYVLFGGGFTGASSITEDDLNGANGFVLRGLRGGVIPIEEDQAIWGDLAGTSIDYAGDINNDGIDDFMIGASHTIINPRRKGVGQTYFIYGSTSAFPQRLSLADLDGANGFRINGIGTVDYFGVYVRRAGDFNADGRDDVIIGASGQSNSYVIYGRDAGIARQPAATAPANPGAASTGFLPVAFSLGADAGPLPFRELPDPTGPNPLPPGTSSVLGDPATPGNNPANTAAAVEPVRPGAPPTNGDASVNPNDSPVTTGDTTATPDDTPSTPGSTPADTDTPDTDAPDDADTGSNSGQSPVLTVGRNGGSAFYLPIMLMIIINWRCLRKTP